MVSPLPPLAVARRLVRWAALAAAAASVGVSPALAQGRPATSQPTQRPYQGLFGGNPSGATRTQSLNFTAAVDGTYQQGGGGLRNLASNVAPGDPGLALATGGWSAGLIGGLSYSRQLKFASFSAGGNASLRYNPNARAGQQTNNVSYSVSTGLGGSIGPLMQYRVSHGVRYSPFFGFGLFRRLGSALDPNLFVDPGFADPGLVNPGLAIDPADAGFDSAQFQSKAFMHTTSARLGRALGERSSISFNYAMRWVDFSDPVFSQTDFRNHRIGTTYSYDLTQNASLQLGYQYQQGSTGFELDGDAPRRIHNVNAGVNYGRGLSLTRRAVLTFGTGSSVVDGRRENETGVVDQPTRLRVNGNASLSYDIGRSWIARVTYRRQLQFIELFSEPFYSDSVSGNVGGFLSRRVNVSGAVFYSRGRVGLNSGSANRNTTTSASARMQFALTQNMAAFAQYFYYDYGFGSRVSLPGGLPRSFNRNGARIGLSYWLPLL